MSLFLDGFFHFLVFPCTSKTSEPLIFKYADDPEVPHVQNHRSFLKEHVVFKEVYFLAWLFLLLWEESWKSGTEVVGSAYMLWTFTSYLKLSIFFSLFVGHTYQRSTCVVKDTPDIPSWLFEGFIPLKSSYYWFDSCIMRSLPFLTTFRM